MNLYYLPAACSLATHITIKELDLEVNLIKVDYHTHTFGNDEEFFKVNPLGYVPALELDNGKILLEGPAINQYLADLRPDLKLAPENGTMERYELQQWLNFLSTEIHKGFIPLLYATKAGKYVDSAKPILEKRYEYVDQELGKHQYLCGDNFSIADAYLFALTGWGQALWLKSYYKADIHFDNLLNLKRWYEQVKSRPKVQDALIEEGLALE